MGASPESRRRGDLRERALSIPYGTATGILTVFTSVFVPSAVMSEVFNPAGTFGDRSVCSAYIEYLNRAEIGDFETCDGLARYLVGNRDAELMPFLLGLTELPDASAVVGPLAFTLIQTVYSDPIGAFTWSELAGRQAGFSFSRKGDFERAAVYAHLVGEIQRDAVVSVCASDAGCDEMVQIASVQELLGDEFSGLDTLRSDWTLHCLLLTDAFVIPLREVLASPAFGACIETEK